MPKHNTSQPNKLNAYKSLSIFLLNLFVMLLIVPSAYAVSNFQFSSETKTVKMGESVEIPIKINTDADLKVRAADLWMLFDQTSLDIQTINPGDFFQETYNNVVGDKLYIAGFFSDTTTVKSGNGTYATVYMTPKKIGTTQLKFDCRGNDVADTSKININPESPQNIIDCASTSQAILTINAVASDGQTAVATPTVAPAGTTGGTTATTGGANGVVPGDSTVTQAPTTLPESGYFDGTLFYILSGGMFVGFGGILRKLYS